MLHLYWEGCDGLQTEGVKPSALPSCDRGFSFVTLARKQNLDIHGYSAFYNACCLAAHASNKFKSFNSQLDMALIASSSAADYICLFNERFRTGFRNALPLSSNKRNTTQEIVLLAYAGNVIHGYPVAFFAIIHSGVSGSAALP